MRADPAKIVTHPCGSPPVFVSSREPPCGERNSFSRSFSASGHLTDGVPISTSFIHFFILPV